MSFEPRWTDRRNQGKIICRCTPIHWSLFKGNFDSTVPSDLSYRELKCRDQSTAPHPHARVGCDFNLTETLVDLLMIREEKSFLFLQSLKHNYGFLLRHEGRNVKARGMLIVTMTHCCATLHSTTEGEEKELFLLSPQSIQPLHAAQKSSSFAVKDRQRKQEQQKELHPINIEK